jgi:hypothetical protein
MLGSSSLPLRFFLRDTASLAFVGLSLSEDTILISEHLDIFLC